MSDSGPSGPTAGPRAAEVVAEPPRRGGGWLRLRALIRKEGYQILRDPSSIAIAFLMPVVLLVLFGYGVSLDAEDVPIALVVEEASADTNSLAGAFFGSRYFAPVYMRDMHEATEAVERGRVDGIVHLQGDFSRRLAAPRTGPAIQVILNGVDANKARLVEGYATGVWTKWLAQRAADAGTPLQLPIQVDHRVWFNSEVRSRNFLVPGLVAIIMTLIGALLTAMVMAREWERGTLEALLVTPVRMHEVLLGKLIPYFLLGMGGLGLSVLMAVFLFEVPLRGSLWVLGVCSSLFLLAALGMGLLISAVTRQQFVAGQTAIVTTFLPAFMLSGFIFDFHSMPPVVDWIARVVAARYYVSILQTVFLAGDIWSVIVPNAAALAVFAAVFLELTRRKSRKSLE